MLAVLPQQAEEVVSSLTWRKDQTIISIVSIVSQDRLAAAARVIQWIDVFLCSE